MNRSLLFALSKVAFHRKLAAQPGMMAAPVPMPSTPLPPAPIPQAPKPMAGVMPTFDQPSGILSAPQGYDRGALKGMIDQHKPQGIRMWGEGGGATMMNRTPQGGYRSAPIQANISGVRG